MRAAHLLLATSLAFVAFAARAGVRVQHDPEADFSRRTTFAWHETPAVAKLRDDEPFLDKHLRRAVRAGLEDKGLALVTEGPASLLVSWTVTSRQRLAISEVPEWHPRRGWWEDDVHVRAYDEVTYTLDLRDGASGELIWRGRSGEPEAAPGREQQQVERAVRRLLKRYPPR